MVYIKANLANIIGVRPEFLIGHTAIVRDVYKRVTFLSPKNLTNSI